MRDELGMLLILYSRNNGDYIQDYEFDSLITSLETFITSLLKKQSKQEQINAMLDVLEDISKFPYSPSQLVPWNHILVEINKKITEIKALNAPDE